ncbi:TPA: signal recognition particle-docking protein FtsY [Candidatus Poribacteria bacterium]|nr:signal recognition particle-docking protein FtsY [Candidatus Poribacteria bacterium]
MFNIFRRKSEKKVEEKVDEKKKVEEKEEYVSEEEIIKELDLEELPPEEEIIFEEEPEEIKKENNKIKKLDIDELSPKPSNKWRMGLTKTRTSFFGRIKNLLSGRTKIDPELLEEMEEILIQSDVGVETTLKIVSNVRERVKNEKLEGTPNLITQLLKDEMTKILGTEKQSLDVESHKPFVIMVLGVNGTGKTTTIAKLSAKFTKEGKKVILAAADTFRAAAVDQLEIWSQRVGGLDFIKHQEGSDPAAVAFDAIQAGIARKCDVVIIDTAGRLHTKKNLMEELKKIKRVSDRALPGAPHEVLLVLDATTGQNAISQVKQFKEAVEVTGIALTKLDGTAKGGIVIAIKDEFGIPVKLVGVGEKLDDLEDFSPKEFVDALFE